MENKPTLLDNNLALLQNFKKQADEVGNLCLSISIVDETSLAIGQQNLAKANELSKAIEEKRKAIKQPYLDAGKKVDEVAKTLSAAIEKGISHIKLQVADWEKKRREEEAKKKQVLDYINGELSTRLQQLYDGADTLVKAEEALKYITERFPKDDKFGDYVSVAHALRDSHINMLNAKIEAFKTGDIRVINSAEALVEDAKEFAAQIQEQTNIAAATTKTRGIREIWDFELTDLSKVPMEWLCLDEAKVKAYVAENKAELKEGIFNGVKFFKKISVTA